VLEELSEVLELDSLKELIDVLEELSD